MSERVDISSLAKLGIVLLRGEESRQCGVATECNSGQTEEGREPVLALPLSLFPAKKAVQTDISSFRCLQSRNAIVLSSKERGRVSKWQDPS